MHEAMKHNDSDDRIEIPVRCSAKHHWRPRRRRSQDCAKSASGSMITSCAFWTTTQQRFDGTRCT